MELMCSNPCNNRHYFIADMQLAHVIGVYCTNEANHCCLALKDEDILRTDAPLSERLPFCLSKASIQQVNLKSINS